jgi:hypothetical protein
MKTTLRRVALATLLSMVPVSAAFAATIKGKVVNTHDLLNPVWNEAKDPAKNRYNFREPAPSVPPDARVLRGHLPREVALVALGEGAAPMKTPLRVIVSGGRLMQTTIVVPPGQELRFENHDPFPHVLHETSGKGGMSKGVLAPGQATPWTTPKEPGVYEIRDELTPSLRAWVVVEPRAVRSVYPNKKGDFAMELEPGSYTLRAYHNGAPVGEELPVEVKPAPAEQLLPNPLKAGADKKKDDKKDQKAGG